MNKIDWAIREHIFEILQNREECTELHIGSDYQDASRVDYSESISFIFKLYKRAFITVESCAITCNLCHTAFKYASVGCIIIDPAVPGFSKVDEAVENILLALDWFTIGHYTDLLMDVDSEGVVHITRSQ